MLTRTVNTVFMLLAATVATAQDPAELHHINNSRFADYYNPYFCELFVQTAPQHRVLKGMGIQLRQITDGMVYEQFELADQTGLVVDNLLANLPANQAGIHWHDIIAKVDGKEICTTAEFISAYEACQSNKVAIEIIQKAKKKTVEIDKAEVAKWERDYRIGVHVDPVPEALALHLGLEDAGERGLFVSGVATKSPAERTGLKKGDILLRANDKWLDSHSTLSELVRESQSKEISLEYLRAGKKQRIKVAAEEVPANPPVSEFRPLPFPGDGFDTTGVSVIPTLPGYGFVDVNLSHAGQLMNLAKTVDRLAKEVAELRAQLEDKE